MLYKERADKQYAFKSFHKRAFRCCIERGGKCAIFTQPFSSNLNSQFLYDDKLLFLKIAEGNEQAFTELFHIYTPKLLPFVIKLTRNEHLAQEMIQETFLRLWVNRSELVNVNEPASWIFRIAANVSITWLRKQGNRERLMKEVKVNESHDPIFEKLESKELNLIINNAVEALPDRRKQIYKLSREEGYNHQQIAERLNLSSTTVANQIGISLKFIREFINKETGLSMVTLLILFSR